MPNRPFQRVQDIKRSIGQIRALLREKTRDDVNTDVIVRAAFERFLEILSEASRHVPAEWKRAHGPDIPWQDVGNLGNILRHVYHRTDVGALWSVYEVDLDPLEKAIDAMLSAHEAGD